MFEHVARLHQSQNSLVPRPIFLNGPGYRARNNRSRSSSKMIILLQVINSCNSAISLVALKIWSLPRDSGLSFSCAEVKIGHQNSTCTPATIFCCQQYHKIISPSDKKTLPFRVLPKYIVVQLIIRKQESCHKPWLLRVSWLSEWNTYTALLPFCC